MDAADEFGRNGRLDVASGIQTPTDLSGAPQAGLLPAKRVRTRADNPRGQVGRFGSVIPRFPLGESVGQRHRQFLEPIRGHCADRGR